MTFEPTAVINVRQIEKAKKALTVEAADAALRAIVKVEGADPKYYGVVDEVRVEVLGGQVDAPTSASTRSINLAAECLNADWLHHGTKKLHRYFGLENPLDDLGAYLYKAWKTAVQEKNLVAMALHLRQVEVYEKFPGKHQLAPWYRQYVLDWERERSHHSSVDHPIEISDDPTFDLTTEGEEDEPTSACSAGAGKARIKEEEDETLPYNRFVLIHFLRRASFCRLHQKLSETVPREE